MRTIRLWHKDLIHYLPKAQLLSQWRECCCIARNIAVKGTPNHILVNEIMDYPLEHFIAYGNMVAQEMRRRGYSCDWNRFYKWFDNDFDWGQEELKREDIFVKWHDKRYMRQCFYNLQEKCDRGGISQKEYAVLYEFVYYEIGSML